MKYEEVGDVDGVPVRMPVDGYRTCSECGGDCEPDVGSGSGSGSGSDESGARIAFVCNEHGMQSMMDPFEDLR